ncbi:MAG: ribonuclease E/G [Anderseniella sp.]|jgi:ribonuclease E|nr:ribonuclease E/G [Anderseniella sp.]
MASKMLIDAAHPEETRVAVVRGNRIEEFDYESASRRPLKGNIYLAKVTRVEPSLQAAFVEYGGNRHGFLAFSEIHPDYYQIPVADRQALLEAEAEDARLAQEEEDDEGERKKPRRRRSRAARSRDDKVASETVDDAASETGGEAGDDDGDGDDADTDAGAEARADAAGPEADEGDEDDNGDDEEVDTVAEDAEEEASVSAPKPRKRAPRKVYKIQEVIKRRQVLLIQVVKEERGNKGAALTTYLSLAGRYCVLMPNTARGGGISRKIADPADRRRLKDVVKEIEVPAGMGLIVRTAGAQRTKTEIKRDYDYLLRMWESVRELTLKSSAPKLVYEEGDLIKRSIRDLYSKDIDEVLVEGEEGYKEAKDFMKMLMPSHARNVKLYKDTRQLFTRHQVESQLDGLFTPTVTLPSGGYIVMNQTEALVSIDINSGKATREHNIEDTALKTNLEASVEIARQLRLRDLAGLIVIDFIDMEENRNNRAVERKLKDALKNDRARIQVGRISHFGLLEMSRQRLRQGMMESSTRQCPHCEGTGVIRAVSSCALSVLRGIEEHLLSRKAESLDVRVHPDVAIYIFNEKREALLSLEQNYGISIWIIPDRECAQAESRIDRKPDRKGPAVRPAASLTAVAMGDELEAADEEPVAEDEDEEDEDADDSAPAGAEARDGDTDENGEPRKKRRRRRGRRGGRRQREERPDGEAMEDDELAAGSEDDGEAAEADEAAEASGNDADGEPRKKRRRRRGGRGRSARSGDEASTGSDSEVEADADGDDADGAVAAAEAVPAEAQPAEAVADEVEAESEDAKPAKKPRKRAAKKAAATDGGEDSSDDAKPAKKPRKRAAKKASPADAAEAAPEPVAAEAGPGDDHVMNGAPAPEPARPQAAEDAAEEPAPRWTPPAPTVDPASAPKKSGWWGKRS